MFLELSLSYASSILDSRPFSSRRGARRRGKVSLGTRARGTQRAFPRRQAALAFKILLLELSLLLLHHSQEPFAPFARATAAALT